MSVHRMKAYKNPDFMMSAEARTLRVMAEYLEPQSRFEKMAVGKTIIFWGSARIAPDRPFGVGGVNYYEAARTLSARLAQWTTGRHPEGQRFFLCTGGGPGIMEAVNQGASEINPSLSIGLGISIPAEQGLNKFIAPALNFEFHYFFMRKFWFVNLAHALVIFPGGFGTMDELFELLTLMQTGKKDRIPVLLFGKQFWNKLINFQLLVEHGLIAEDDLRLMHLTDDLDDAFEYLTREMEPDPGV